MSAGLFEWGRCALGLVLVGCLFLWVRQARLREVLPSVLGPLIASRLHYGVAGAIGGYTVVPVLRDPFAEGAVLAMAFFATWFGLVVGCSLDLRGLRRVPLMPLLVEIGQVGLVAVSVFLAAYLAGGLLEQGRTTVRGPALLMLCGLCAAGMPRHTWSDRRERTVLRREGWQPAVAATLGIGLVGLGSMQLRHGHFEIRHLLAPPTKVIVVEGLVAEAFWSLVLGSLTGLLIDLLYRGGDRRAHFFLLAAGLLLGGGLAAALGLEPLWVGLVAGFWLINATLQRLDILRVAQRTHGMMKIGLFFSGGWLLGQTAGRSGVDLGVFSWVLVLLVVLQPVARIGGLQVAGRVLERGVLKRTGVRVADLVDLDDLGVIVAATLMLLLPERAGAAVLAAAMAGQLALHLVRSWLEKVASRHPLLSGWRREGAAGSQRQRLRL